MKPLGLLLAGILVALPISYEWIISRVGPLLFDALWQSVEAIARGQALALLLLAVVIPVVLLCHWLKRMWDRLT